MNSRPRQAPGLVPAGPLSIQCHQCGALIQLVQRPNPGAAPPEAPHTCDLPSSSAQNTGRSATAHVSSVTPPWSTVPGAAGAEQCAPRSTRVEEGWQDTPSPSHVPAGTTRRRGSKIPPAQSGLRQVTPDWLADPQETESSSRFNSARHARSVGLCGLKPTQAAPSGRNDAELHVFGQPNVYDGVGIAGQYMRGVRASARSPQGYVGATPAWLDDGTDSSDFKASLIEKQL
jgi:hypothetical protein